MAYVAQPVYHGLCTMACIPWHMEAWPDGLYTMAYDLYISMAYGLYTLAWPMA